MSTANSTARIATALSWCLAWGETKAPSQNPASLQQMLTALRSGDQSGIPPESAALVQQIQQLQQNPSKFPETPAELQALYPEVWQQTTRIGLVYGGATKIKGYVFESAKLPEIRGASALLDRINLIDLPAFFGDPEDTYAGWADLDETSRSALKRFVKDPEPKHGIHAWLEQHYPGLASALIPELIIYSTGGNILAFCPAAWVNDLADAIERRYTQETLTANACAVGSTFRLLELRYGLLRDPIEETPWLDWLTRNNSNPLVQAYYGKNASQKEFESRKNFNELVGHLAAQFNHRRNGNPDPNRPSRAHPAFFETHPYIRRDSTDRRSAIAKAELPGEPWLSEATARKALVGRQAKRMETGKQGWFRKFPEWDPGFVESWVSRFARFLDSSEGRFYQDLYYKIHEEKAHPHDTIGEAQSLREIANASSGCQGFVAYIYADGNNMGGYIQKQIKTPEAYQRFSQDVSEATEKAVYHALAQHLQAHQIHSLQQDSETGKERNGRWIHPFEILTVGGDDVFVIVPAHKALDIATTFCEQFEQILLSKSKDYAAQSPGTIKQRYQPYGSDSQSAKLCQLSSSAGVLIASEDTPIYYAQKLTDQLCKSAKTYSKKLKPAHSDSSVATLDFLTLKSVTMIASSIKEFRQQALEISKGNHTLQLYAAPYTVQEVHGLLKTVQALKVSGFPRSQLYQMRSFLEKGKRTATLNYLYFRTRLGSKGKPLVEAFEQTWCKAKTNDGYLPPWMHLGSEGSSSVYETIWQDLVDLYGFVQVEGADQKVGALAAVEGEA
ncbi:type III-B CRISPR-associated protein Cas10/Cmr2 [Thermostichus vulcanus]|nr:type III-B CRISPR-associated protein Cas10/Cmr2 [Thermostichus vulcanus]